MIPHQKSPYLSVIGMLKARPGKEEILKEALLKQVLEIYKEPGYIQFDVHQSQDDPSLFMLYENWTDAEALRVHFTQEHTQKLVARFEDLLLSPLEAWNLTKLEPLI